jgi:hypothetical protein
LRAIRMKRLRRIIYLSMDLTMTTRTLERHRMLPTPSRYCPLQIRNRWEIQNRLDRIGRATRRKRRMNKTAYIMVFSL